MAANKSPRDTEQRNPRGMTTQGGRNLSVDDEGPESIRGARAGREDGGTISEGDYSREGKVRGRNLAQEEEIARNTKRKRARETR